MYQRFILFQTASVQRTLIFFLLKGTVHWARLSCLLLSLTLNMICQMRSQSTKSALPKCAFCHGRILLSCLFTVTLFWFWQIFLFILIISTSIHKTRLRLLSHVNLTLLPVVISQTTIFLTHFILILTLLLM